MSSFRDPPTAAAYGRSTDRERFAPLHEMAATLVGTLASSYRVTSSSTFPWRPGRDVPVQTRAPVMLVPDDAREAPLAVAFTAFPGLVVHMGAWTLLPFPTCGCDACAERVEDEVERLQQLVAAVVEGRLRESVHVPLVGEAWVGWELASGPQLPPSRRARERVNRGDARALQGGAGGVRTWQPWTRRAPTRVDPA